MTIRRIVHLVTCLFKDHDPMHFTSNYDPGGNWHTYWVCRRCCKLIEHVLPYEDTVRYRRGVR